VVRIAGLEGGDALLELDWVAAGDDEVRWMLRSLYK
jgi:hypothetical protein